MAGSADLLRSVRAGGGGAAAAARELVRRAQTGALAPAELREVQKAASSPELKDLFGGGLGADLAALTGGGEVFRDVGTLSPDTSRLTDARALPERFLADLQLVKGGLLGHPGMSRTEQAARLFEFFETYAERFNELANGSAQQTHFDEAALALAPPLNDAEWGKTLAQFDKALTRAQFNELTTGDGRTGLEAAREMLEARTPQEFHAAKPASVDAPNWKDNAEKLKTEVEVNRRAVAFDSANTHVQPQLKVAQPTVEDPEAKKDGKRNTSKGKDGVLSSKTLWNVLHMLRGEDLDDVARKDAMTQLAVAAGLLLTLGAILVVVLVWM
ncbi:MAG: hypothetical protein ACO1OB_07575 [Archangium sp.]